MSTDPNCRICGSREESIGHIFAGCGISVRFWFAPAFGKAWQVPDELTGMEILLEIMDCNERHNSVGSDNNEFISRAIAILNRI